MVYAWSKKKTHFVSILQTIRTSTVMNVFVSFRYWICSILKLYYRRTFMIVDIPIGATSMAKFIKTPHTRKNDDLFPSSLFLHIYSRKIRKNPLGKIYFQTSQKELYPSVQGSIPHFFSQDFWRIVHCCWPKVILFVVSAPSEKTPVGRTFVDFFYHIKNLVMSGRKGEKFNTEISFFLNISVFYLWTNNYF